MAVLETILWILALLWTIAQGLLTRQKAKSEQASEGTFEVHAFLLAVSVAAVPALSLSPLHLIWMVPGSFLVGLASVIFPFSLLRIPASLYCTLWYVGIRNPALTLYRAGEYARAIDAFKQAIRQKPNSAENHFYLALAYDKLGDHSSAITSFQECIRLDPDSAEAHCNLGVAFKDAGDLQSALEAFSHAIQLRPNYARAITNLGMIYVELGDLVNAGKQCAILEALDAAQASELRAAIAEVG
jgi:tetratricopeptide (TPR) repeat protein